jgi:hypothetical protein
VGMTPEEFFEAFVEDKYEDYANNPGSIRSAFHSAVTSTGAVEYISFDCEGPDVKEIEEQFDPGDSGMNVIYQRKDGQKLEFLPVIKKMINFWNDFFHAQQASRT